MERLVAALKTLGHPERLRILVLLSHGELTVSELVQIMGMSQPRITQYIKSLEEAGIIERLKEGSWVFSRINRSNSAITALIATTLNGLPQDDPTLSSDLRRLEDVRSERSKSAEAFFADVANDRGQLGDEYLPQSDIEALALDMLGEGPFDFAIDMGTGTGRMLTVLADRIKRGTGIDNNTDMLKVARHKLSADQHTHISFRQSDLQSTPLETGCADLVTLHQVLHYLDDPQLAIDEAARLLQVGGQLLIIDFARHDIEMFRDKYAHRRLGFSDSTMIAALEKSGLSVTDSKTLSSPPNKPDVTIWLAEKPSVTSQKVSAS